MSTTARRAARGGISPAQPGFPQIACRSAFGSSGKQEIPSTLPVTDAAIECAARKLGPPSANPVRLPAWCSAIAPGSFVPAAASHSKNKLLSGAYLPVAEAGRWDLA